MTSSLSTIPERNLETSVEYLQRHLLNHPASSGTDHGQTDRSSDLGADVPCPLH